METNNFETGAKTENVNNLLLFVQTTRNLNERLKEKFKYQFQYGAYNTAPPDYILNVFCIQSESQYEYELKEPIKLSRNERANFVACLQAQYMDWKEQNYGLRAVKVTYSDGNEITTSMAHGLTDQAIKEYFAIGKTFNIGTVDDNLQKVTKCEILK